MQDIGGHTVSKGRSKARRPDPSSWPWWACWTRHRAGVSTCHFVERVNPLRFNCRDLKYVQVHNLLVNKPLNCSIKMAIKTSPFESRFILQKVTKSLHMGPEDPSNRKKYPSFFSKPNFRKLQNYSKNVSLKIGSKVPQRLGPFFPHEKNTFQWSKAVSEAIVPTN